MKATVLARRYAKALFELAVEKNIVDAVAGEIHAFQQILVENAELQHFFLSPEQGKAAKREFFEKNFQDRFSALFINFLLLLLEKGRQNIYGEIVAEFEHLRDRHYNRVRASAITAHPISEQELLDIGKSLAKKYQATFEIENTVDPEILGGIIINIDGKVLDASLKTQLLRLRARLLSDRN